MHQLHRSPLEDEFCLFYKEKIAKNENMNTCPVEPSAYGKNFARMKLVGHRCTRSFFHDAKFSLPYRESRGIQNSADIFGKSRSIFLKYKTMK